MNYRYMARVELSEPAPHSGLALHAAMAEAGFSLRETAPGEPAPVGAMEFVRDCELDLDQVFELARTAASRTGIAFSVLVTEATSRRWIGVKVCRRAS